MTKLFKLLVVIDLDGQHAFCNWFTLADDSVHAIDSVKTLVTTAFPTADVFVDIKGD
jgi:hypothetical protein